MSDNSDDEGYLTRDEVATEYYKQLGCDSPLKAKSRLVGYAAYKTGPAYIKLGGLTSPALYKRSDVEHWLEERRGKLYGVSDVE